MKNKKHRIHSKKKKEFTQRNKISMLYYVLSSWKYKKLWVPGLSIYSSLILLFVIQTCNSILLFFFCYGWMLTRVNQKGDTTKTKNYVGLILWRPLRFTSFKSVLYSKSQSAVFENMLICIGGIIEPQVSLVLLENNFFIENKGHRLYSLPILIWRV